MDWVHTWYVAQIWSFIVFSSKKSIFGLFSRFFFSRFLPDFELFLAYIGHFGVILALGRTNDWADWVHTWYLGLICDNLAQCPGK